MFFLPVFFQYIPLCKLPLSTTYDIRYLIMKFLKEHRESFFLGPKFWNDDASLPWILL